MTQNKENPSINHNKMLYNSFVTIETINGHNLLFYIMRYYRQLMVAILFY